MSFATKLKELRIAKGISQEALGKLCKVTKSAISTYERGKREPGFSTLASLSKVLNVDIYTLMDATTGPSISAPAVKIPVLKTIIAGIPIESTENIVDYEVITPAMAAQGKHLAFRINDNSMLPEMHEGDVAIVREQENVENGDVAIVLVNKHEAVVRIVRKVEEGLILMAYDAMKYGPNFYQNDEAKELPIKIIGKVVEVRRKL